MEKANKENRKEKIEIDDVSVKDDRREKRKTEGEKKKIG